MTRIALSTSADDLPGGAAQTGEAELGRLQGTWKFVSIEDEGGRAFEDDLVSVTVVIEGDQFTLTNGPTIHHGILTVNPAVCPKTIDVVFSKGPLRGTTTQGIYELDGDILKVCNRSQGEGRPTGFASEPGSGLTLQVLKRAKPPIARTKG
jgi:uncharacterized protein (TIGR03067 family)